MLRAKSVLVALAIWCVALGAHRVLSAVLASNNEF